MKKSIRRSGFTLVELMVVMGLIILLAAIAVGVSYSGLIDNYRTVGAGDRVSGWLLQSKSKAQRDGAPRGVRFMVDPVTGNIKEAQFIEVPDTYVPIATVPTNPPRVVISSVGGVKSIGMTGSFDPSALLNNVQAGDTISLPEFRLLLRVLSVSATGAIQLATPSLLPDLALSQQYSTTCFGFHRAARPMLGEPILQLTGQTCIDRALSKIDVNPDGISYDVLFAPNGEVLNTARGSIILWVRDPSLNPALTAASPRIDFEKAGQMGLVTVYTRTGSIATHPVMPPPNTDPYSATKDGINTGL